MSDFFTDFIDCTSSINNLVQVLETLVIGGQRWRVNRLWAARLSCTCRAPSRGQSSRKACWSLTVPSPMLTKVKRFPYTSGCISQSLINTESNPLKAHFFLVSCKNTKGAFLVLQTTGMLLPRVCRTSCQPFLTLL